MADLQTSALCLQWGRQPDGRFFIAVTAQVELPHGAGMLPLNVWALTKEEEAALKAALSGLVVASNGHVPSLH